MGRAVLLIERTWEIVENGYAVRDVIVIFLRTA
jgi:hypothetical protein